jgi:hypothetical protein
MGGRGDRGRLGNQIRAVAASTATRATDRLVETPIDDGKVIEGRSHRQPREAGRVIALTPGITSQEHEPPNKGTCTSRR